MPQRDYLTVSDVLSMHAVLLQRYGGARGVRDAAALEAALFRPQSGYYADILAEAAALFESLAINHPFIDGNKRVAFAVVDVFLRIKAGACAGRLCKFMRKSSPCWKRGPSTLPISTHGYAGLRNWPHRRPAHSSALRVNPR